MKTYVIVSALNLDNPFIKLLLPLAGIAAIVFLCKQKWHISLDKDLKLVFPSSQSFVVWIAAIIVWMLVTDYLINWRGSFNFAIWQTQPFYLSFIRVMAICFAGPIVEELIFRGILFFRLNKRYPDKPWIIIVVLSAIWSVIHYDYTPQVLFIIFMEGILLGAALLKSQSLYVPITMHICWNLYAIW